MYISLSGTPCSDITAAACSCTKDAADPSKIICTPAPQVMPSTTELLSALAPGDQFTANDFVITVTSISSPVGGGQEGVGTGFSGEGYVTPKLLGGTPTGVTVEFTGIKINPCYQLIEGTIKTKFDPSWSNVVDVGAIYESLKEQLIKTEESVEKSEKLIEKILELNQNPAQNKQAILDELAKLKAEVDKQLENSCMSQAEKDEILRQYNEMVAYVNSRPNARLAAPNADDPLKKYLLKWGETLFVPVMVCAMTNSGYEDLIHLLVQETEFAKSLARINGAGVVGDAKCNLLFTEGFVNEFLGNMDVVAISEFVAKEGKEKLKSIIDDIARGRLLPAYDQLPECALDKQVLKPIATAFQIASTLYSAVSTAVGQAYDCECWQQNGSAAASKCAYIRGQIVGFISVFVLEEIATGGVASAWLGGRQIAKYKKVAKTLQVDNVVIVRNGFSGQDLTDLRNWIRNQGTDLSQFVRRIIQGELPSVRLTRTPQNLTRTYTANTLVNNGRRLIFNTDERRAITTFQIVGGDFTTYGQICSDAVRNSIKRLEPSLEELNAVHNASGHGIDILFAKRDILGRISELIVVEVKSAERAVFNTRSHTFELGAGHNSFELYDPWIRGQQGEMARSAFPIVRTNAAILDEGINNRIVKKFIAGVDNAGVGYILRVQ